MNTEYNSNTLKDLKIPETELKSSTLYKTVPDDKLKLYYEEKQKVTQEMRKSGMFDVKTPTSKPTQLDEVNIHDELRNSSNSRW